MSHLRRFSSCLVVAGCLIPGVVWSAPPADRADREQKVVELFARGGDATALRAEIAREGAVRRAPLGPESRETADLRGALETMARQSRGVTARRAALTAEELTGLLAAYDRLRAADLSLRARFRGAGERIASRKLAGGAAGRLAEAEASYTAAAERILNPLSAPAEAARKALQDKKPLAAAAADLARALEAVTPALSAAAEPMAHPILRASELPYRRTGLAPRAPVTAPAVQPSYLDPTGAQPTGADRSGTTQAPLTPEILAKAAELGHDYTRIYQFVRNNIRTEWYAGGMKGAAGTLLQGSGNDVDQASLLIALLRASDAPARYVHGVVELPVDAVAESLGVPAASVPAALARAGVALTPVVHGGKVAAVQVEQTWVSAYVPYTNYRGAVVDFSGKTWVPLAPARKGVADVLPTGILRRMAYSVDGAIASTLAAPQADDPLAAIRRDVEAWLARNASGETWDGQLGSRSIKPEDLELLPSSLPMTVVAVTGEEADLAAAQTHSLHLLVRSGDAADAPDAPVILDLTLPLAAVESHRLTLSYLPATVDDQATIDAFGGLSLVPPYLVKLRPEIRLDGRAVAVGTDAVDMAAAHTFELLVDGPFGEERIDETAIAGGYYALGVSAQQARHHVASADEVLDPADDEYLAARLLSQIALGYSERWDQGEATLAGLLSISVVRPLPTVAVAGTAVTVESAFGLPQSLRFDGVTLDASLRVAEPLARTADTAAPRDWMRLSALEGSALEHFVFEQDFLVDSISADKGLGAAHQAGMDVLHIDAQNATTVIPTLQQPDAVKQEIQDWVRQGMTVDVPRSAVVRADWQGSVWRVEDPVSGGGGYFISGGLAGGATAVTPDAWVLGFLADVLRSPYFTGPNTNPLAGVLLRKVAGSDQQLREVDTELVRPLEAMVTDIQGRPVKGARVTFTTVEGGGHLTDANHFEVASLTVLTDFRGIASAPFKLGQHTADNPVYIRVNAVDINTTRALDNVIDVTAESLAGPLITDSPFEVIGYPGLPVELKRTDRDGTIFNNTAGVGMWADTLAIQARDRLGNPVSNVDVTFAVDPVSDHDTTCENQPRSLVSAVVFDPAVDAAGKLLHCPNQHPLLGDCGQPTLKLKTSSTGVSAGLILGNSINYIYTVNVAADPLPGLRFAYSEVVVADGSTHYCAATQFRIARSIPTDERGDPITATRAGHALAQPIEAGLLYWRPSFTVESRPTVKPDGSAGREFYRHDLLDGHWEWITGNVVFQVGNGGQASPAVLTADQTNYRTTVTTGPTPAANPVSLHADQLKVTYDDVDPITGKTSIVTKVLPSNLYRIDGPVLDVWGIEPKIVSAAPSPVPLTNSGRAAEQVVVGYTVDPPAYASSATEMDLFASGVVQGTAVGTSRSGSGLANIQRGFPFAAGSTYETELVINRGTPFEVHGDRFLLPTHSGIFFNIHGENGGISDGTQTIFLSQDVDLVNQRYCAIGGNFHFDLAQPAKVTLTVRKINAIQPDGSPVVGPPSELFGDRPLAAGSHDYTLGPGGLAATDFELPPGRYQLEMRGVAQSDGSVDTVQAFVESEYRTRDSLPIGHVIVQGVDLWDGHLTLSREDFRIPGRGAALEFQRTYSSGGGDAIGPLGAVWSHNYESRVIISSCGDVILIGGEGGGMRFVSDGTGGFKPLRGSHGTLLINPAADGFDFYSKNGTRYHYVHSVSKEFPLAWIQDPDGNTTTLEYDTSSDQPQLVAVHDAAGRTLAFTYDRRGFFGNRSGPVLVQVTGPDGISLSFDYDVYGNLIRAAREGNSRVETYAYAPPQDFGPACCHQLTDVTNVLNGAVTHYDAAQGVIGLQGANASIPTIYVTKVREPEGGETTFSFDQAALSSRTTPVLTSTVTDPRQKVTTYTLNQYGSPLTITDPLQHTTAMEWSLSDVLMMSRTDANGVVTRFTYDANGNQLTESVDVTDVDGTPHTYTTTTEYWPPTTFTPPYIKEHVKTHTDRNGTVTSSVYDTHGHLTGQQVLVMNVDTVQEKLTTAHTYLPNGDLASTTDPRHNTTTVAYDVYGNVAKVTDPLHGETTTEWSVRSLPVLVRDALGRETRQDYDTLGRPTSKTLPKTLDEGNPPTETTVYDDAHNQVTQTDAEGRVTTSTTDRQGRLLEVVNPLTGVKAYEYDLAGNKIKESNWHDAATPRTDVLFTYDDAGRLIRRDEPLNRVTEYAYDAAGNTTRETLRDGADASFAPRVVDIRYDALNRKVQEDHALDSSGVVTALFVFDGNGNKLKETDPLGRITTYRYDALNRLIEKHEPEWQPSSPKTTQYLYDGNGNLTEERRLNRPQDQIRKTEYDELNRPRKHINAEGNATLAEYDAVGNLTQQIDARLDVVKNDYDARNRLIQTTTLLNRVTQPARQVVTQYGYDKVGNRTLEIWPNGNQLHHVYDGLNRLLSTADSLGAVSSTDYDANGNKTEERDANGHETHNTYDALFRLIQQDLPAQRTVHFTYDAAGNKTSQTDPRGHVSQLQYDRLNRLIKTIDPAPFAYEMTYAYDEVGNKIDETDRRGHTTHFDYNVLNRLVKHTDPAPLSYVMTYVYDAVGNRVSETDRRGIVTETAYDRENRPTQVKRAGVVLHITQYDDNGNKLFVTDANGNTTGWEYDERNLVTAENRPLAAITHFTLDDMGDRAALTDPEGRVTTYAYDARRRMTTETNFANETTAYAYDLKGNRTGVTHPKQNAWAYRYDAADRLQEVEDPLHAVTAYAYDESSNRTTQTDANHHATSFEYDELNRVTAMVYPDQARETYRYDENGNRLEQIDPKGQRILSSYDEINRETLRTYPTAAPPADVLQSIATVHDANNNPLTITETFSGPTGTAVTTKTYDDFDRLTTVTDRYGKKLLYVYDANGNRKSLQDPDAKVTRYDFDGLNRLTAVTLTGAGVTNYDYYRDSRLKQVTYPNGTVEANTYDAATRVATITNRQAATVVSSYAYQYDKNGNRTQQIEVNGGAPETTTYQFDTADRLTQVSYPDKTVAYTYDAEGNRHTEQVRDVQNTLTADKTSTFDVRNRLLSTTDALNNTAGVTYTYDTNGNRISRQQGSTTTDLIYDVRDELTEVRSNSTLLETYAYDYRGMRVRKAGSGVLLRYVYDDKSVLLQTDDFGNTLSKYDYGPDRLLALTSATQGRQFYLFDALGSIADLMTPGGGIQARYQYDAWGNDRGHTGTSANIFGFTGHELDAATGLYYFKARFYDPETGLFLTVDPAAGKAENPPSLHRYLYAYENPTVYIDLNGEDAAAVALKAYKDRINALPPKERAAYLERQQFQRDVLGGTLEGVGNSIMEFFVNNIRRRFEPELLSRDQRLPKTEREKYRKIARAEWLKDETLGISGFVSNFLNAKDKKDFLNSWFNRNVGPDKFAEANAKLAEGVKVRDPLLIIEGGGKGLEASGQVATAALLLTEARDAILPDGGGVPLKKAPGFERGGGRSEKLQFRELTDEELRVAIGGGLRADAESVPGVLERVPGRVQSRINVSKEGMTHLVDRHLSSKNASQFSITEAEVRSLLTSKEAVRTPVTEVVESSVGLRYVRVLNVGRDIGFDKFDNYRATQVMTIMTDKSGSLVTAFPGVLSDK